MRITQGTFAVMVLVLAWGCASAWAQSPAPTMPGVYTCVDTKGRKLTSDRPILDCIDREQVVLNPSGTVKAKIGPTLTAQERAQQEQKERREIEEQNRLAEERRRDRALLTRYPSQAVHDRERQQALGQIDVVIQTAKTRLEDLIKQRTTLDTEMEFYKKDPSKAPLSLRRQVEENKQNQATQKRFINDQEAEIRRVMVRFDDELVRLRQLWPQNGTPGAQSSTSAPH